MKPIVYVIGGPTASGKSKLAVELAKKVNGEIISADSMQIYKEMNIGTAKVNKEEMQGVQHYLVDFVSPDERYSVSNFKKDAEKAVDLEYREKLNKIADEKGLESLYKKAQEIDPEAMKKISINDRKRIIRVLEIYHKTGKTKTEQELQSRKNEVKYEYKVFAITMDREKLYERIEKRIDFMIEQGLIEEVKQILEKYHTFPTAMQGLGYKEVVEYLEGSCTKEEMIEKIKKETRHYAKRQLTWFRKNKEIIWLDGEKSTDENVSIILGL